MNGYLGSLMRMTGINFGGESSAGHLETAAGPQPIHKEETRFVEPPAQPTPIGRTDTEHPVYQASTDTLAESIRRPVPAPAKIKTGTQDTQTRQSKPGKEKTPAAERKPNEEQGKTPEHFDQMKPVESFEAVELVRPVRLSDWSDWSDQSDSSDHSDPVRPEIIESLEFGSESHGKQEVFDSPVALVDVTQWVEDTPQVYPQYPRRPQPEVQGVQGVQGIQEVQEFSLSIGSINLTVEEPQPLIRHVPLLSPPVGGGQASVGGSGSPASRLGRHYIRVR